MQGLQSLGIDFSSLLIYAVNFGLLVGVTYVFFYKKIVKAMDERRETITSRLEQADKIKNEFQEKLAEMEASKKAKEAELNAELDKMKSFIADKKKALVAEMDKERSVMLEKTAKEIEDRKNKLVSEVEKELLNVVQKIVLEVVENRVPQEAIKSSVDDAWKNYSMK
jgi:F-type H+-transporting ATPase subunit b